MSKSFLAVSLLGVALAAGKAAAAPIAKVAPLVPGVPAALAAQRAKMVPDAADVPLPAYPNSYFISSMSQPGGGLLAVVLVSNDPPSKVRAWYAAHLKSMQYFPKYKSFGPPGYDKGTIAQMMRKLHVSIRPQKPEGMLIHFAHLPDVKTRIELDFMSGKGK